MTYTQAPAVCQKNSFHLFCASHPVENYSAYCYVQQIGLSSAAGNQLLWPATTVNRTSYLDASYNHLSYFLKTFRLDGPNYISQFFYT